ncbi:MAG: PD-(D/E)XK motif protein [Paludibacteraceae bacterium]|nr:PD-(D/E)XK motif protein [Paludibacteraceae bacterium]
MEYLINEKNIKEQFKKLELHKVGEESYKVISLPELQHKLGKTDEGYPKFFICVNESISQLKDINREFLTIEYNKTCIVESENGCEEKMYSIITLRSPEWTLQSSFIDIVLLMMNNMQPMPSRKDLDIEVEKLITIFSAMQNPPVKKMQGLWGEMLVIEQSKYPETLINAWHKSPNAKFDFTLGRDKIEVKTTSCENRIHRFSLDQLNPSANSQLLIASITVRESGKGNGGKSIRDLFDSIYAKVTSCQERLRVYMIMAETIGCDINKLDSVYFDYTEAVDSLKYFRAQDIPHIESRNVPKEVTEVRFTSNLEDVPDAFTLECSMDYKKSPLFKSII